MDSVRTHPEYFPEIRGKRHPTLCVMRIPGLFQAESLDAFFAQNEFLYFARHSERKFLDELDIVRDFVMGDFAIAEGPDLVRSQRWIFRDDPCGDLFAISRFAHNARVSNRVGVVAPKIRA